jgi:hypothetical protein
MGFTSNPQVTGTLSTGTSNGGDLSPNGGRPWTFLRENGAMNVYAGSATVAGTGTGALGGGLPAGTYPDGSSYTISLVLNTALSNWTLDTYVNGVQLDLNGATAGDTYTYASNPSGISYVAISASPSTVNPIATVDNFTLTVQAVPEPSTFGVLVLGGLTFASIARVRSSKKSV